MLLWFWAYSSLGLHIFRVSSISTPCLLLIADRGIFPKNSTPPTETTSSYSSSLRPLLHLLFLLLTGMLPNLYKDLGFTSPQPGLPDHPIKSAASIYHISIQWKDLSNSKEKKKLKGGRNKNYFKVTIHLLIHNLVCKLGSLPGLLLYSWALNNCANMGANPQHSWISEYTLQLALHIHTSLRICVVNQPQIAVLQILLLKKICA